VLIYIPVKECRQAPEMRCAYALCTSLWAVHRDCFGRGDGQAGVTVVYRGSGVKKLCFPRVPPRGNVPCSCTDVPAWPGRKSCSCRDVQSPPGEFGCSCRDVQTRRGRFPWRVLDVQNWSRKGWRSYTHVRTPPGKRWRRFPDAWSAGTAAFYRSWDVVAGARKGFSATATGTAGERIGRR